MTEYEQGYTQGLRDALETARHITNHGYPVSRANVVSRLTGLLTSFLEKFKK